MTDNENRNAAGKHDDLDARAHGADFVAKLKQAQEHYGRGPGGREMALAVTNAEQAMHWLYAAMEKKPRSEEGEG